MLIKPTRRELVKYGIGAAAFSKMARAQAAFPGPGVKAYSAGGGTPTLIVQEAAGSTGNTNNVTTPGVNTTGANFAYAFIGFFQSASTPTFSDSKGNTWNALTRQGGANQTNAIAYWSNLTSVGASHTVTVTGSIDFPGVCVAYFSNVKTSSPGDGEDGNTTAVSVTSLAAGATGLTTTVNNDLVLTGISINVVGNDPTSINGSFTYTATNGVDKANFTTSVNFGAALAYRILATAGAVNPTWTLGGLTGATTDLVAFKSI